MVNNGWSCREFEDEDYEMAVAWSEVHGRRLVPKQWLPATGFVIARHEEPKLMLWLYFEATCPVCIVDWVISRPGNTQEESRAAALYAIEVPVVHTMRLHGAEMLSSYSPMPFARTMVKHGWRTDATPLYPMQKVLSDEE
jgi:hypothetical protein